MLEDAGVLDGLVVALGNREDHDREVLAEVEVDGAYEVADVLDEDDVDGIEAHALVEGVNRLFDHVALEMAQTARVDLHGGDTRLLHGHGVDVGGDVALDNGGAVAVAEALVGGEDGGGLARAGAREHVYHVHLVLGKALAQLGSQALVARKNGFIERDGLLGH